MRYIMKTTGHSPNRFEIILPIAKKSINFFTMKLHFLFLKYL